MCKRLSWLQTPPALLPGSHSWKKTPKGLHKQHHFLGQRFITVVSAWPSPAAEKLIKCHTIQARNLPPGLWSSVSCCSEAD